MSLNGTMAIAQGETAVDAGRGVAHSNSEGISSDLIQIELERIIASSALMCRTGIRAFLRFIVEETLAGRGDRIKAYTIGTSVLQRDETFDPQADPIVRIEASRLRRSLERYYLTAGQGDLIRIEIPKGAYVPTFRRLRSIPDESAAPQDAPAPGLPLGQLSILADRHEARTRRPGIYTSLRSRRVTARGAWAAVALGRSPSLSRSASRSGTRRPSRRPLSRSWPAAALPSSCCRSTTSAMRRRRLTWPGSRQKETCGLAQFKELFVYANETSARYGSATNYRELHRELESATSCKVVSERLRDASV